MFHFGRYIANLLYAHKCGLQLHDGRGGSANRYAKQPKSVGLGDKKRFFLRDLHGKRDRKEVVLHAYCYANGSDSSVSVSIS